MSRTFKENMQAFAIKQVLNYLDEDPDKSLPKILEWAEKFDKDGRNAHLIKPFHAILDDPDNNWHILIKSLWTDIDPEVRKVFFENFILNTTLIGSHQQDKWIKTHNCNIPWAILMDPTSACNLKCTGCWAADYGRKLNLEYEVLDDIICQGTEMGTYMYIYSGGEPLVRKNDIIRLCEAHPDCMFLAFTNGTLIDEKFADEMLRVKNFAPAVSIEDLKKRPIIVEARELIRKSKCYAYSEREKLPFGASCCYTSRNIDSLSSEEYIDMLVDSGRSLHGSFTICLLVMAVPELLPSPEQREIMYRKIREYRIASPFLLLTFK